jgi:hypothetical protein
MRPNRVDCEVSCEDLVISLRFTGVELSNKGRPKESIKRGLFSQIRMGVDGVVCRCIAEVKLIGGDANDRFVLSVPLLDLERMGSAEIPGILEFVPIGDGYDRGLWERAQWVEINVVNCLGQAVSDDLYSKYSQLETARKAVVPSSYLHMYFFSSLLVEEEEF